MKEVWDIIYERMDNTCPYKQEETSIGTQEKIEESDPSTETCKIIEEFLKTVCED